MHNRNAIAWPCRWLDLSPREIQRRYDSAPNPADSGPHGLDTVPSPYTLRTVYGFRDLLRKAS